jgi:hypothetical protein
MTLTPEDRTKAKEIRDRYDKIVNDVNQCSAEYARFLNKQGIQFNDIVKTIRPQMVRVLGHSTGLTQIVRNAINQ